MYPQVMLKLNLNADNGYVYVSLTDSKGKQFSRRIHRLVAKAFITNADNLPEVNHEDFNKQNNNASNLKWCDRFYQNQHAAKKPGRKWQNHRKGMFGAKNFKSKAVIAIGMDGSILGRFESGCIAAKSLGVTQAKVSACCRGTRNHTKNIKFKYA